MPNRWTDLGSLREGGLTVGVEGTVLENQPSAGIVTVAVCRQPDQLEPGNGGQHSGATASRNLQSWELRLGLLFFLFRARLLSALFAPKYFYLACKNLGLSRHAGSIVRWFRAGKKTEPARALRQADPSSSAEAEPGGGVAVAPPAGNVSLEGVHGSVKLPDHEAGFWQQWWVFSGPAVLVSVGYMDPGNWGTDLQAGAKYKFGLLWVVGMASLMAIFMQVIAARLGVVTGKDLAQCCRDWFPRWTRWPNWLLCEVAIGACDLAEVLGTPWR